MSGRSTGCTLAAYSEATGLPEEFLRAAGVVEGTRRGAKVVKVPYRSAEGRDLGTAVCVAPPEGDHLGEWTRNDGLGLYGLEALIAPRVVCLVAGEVDAQTLRFHGVAALGLPRTDAWQTSWTSSLNGVETIYVVVSREDGELELPAWLPPAPLRNRVFVMPLDDDLSINALHRLTREEFPEAWSALRASTVPAPLIEQQQRQRRRSEALTRCAGLEAQADILDAFGQTLRMIGYAGDLRAAKLLYLVVTTRALNTPASVAVKGPSAAGKSFVVKQVLRFPHDAYYAVTAMSDKALIYSTEPLEHRMLVIQEADGLSEVANLIVRSLLSEGRVVYDTVIEMQGVRIDRPGPTGLITTTTRIGLHPDNETRLISMTIPDDPDRIREVLLAVAREDDCDDVDLTPWHALQQALALSDARVSVPFGQVLAAAIPPVDVRLQRDLKAVLQLVRAHALLHEESRERDARGRLLATMTDYASVRELVHDLLSESAEQTVPPTVRETVDAMIAMGPVSRPDEKGLSITQLSYGLKVSRSQVSRRLKRAESLGFVAETTGSKSGKQKRFVIGERRLGADEELLPTVERLEELCRCARTSGEGQAPEDDSR